MGRESRKYKEPKVSLYLACLCNMEPSEQDGEWQEMRTARMRSRWEASGGMKKAEKQIMKDFFGTRKDSVFHSEWQDIYIYIFFSIVKLR